MRQADPESDPVVRELRGQITDADRAVLEAVNRRLELVRELRAYKVSKGWGFVDRGREERLLEALVRENPGPLTADSVRELFVALLDLTKREVDGGPPAPGEPGR